MCLGAKNSYGGYSTDFASEASKIKGLKLNSTNFKLKNRSLKAVIMRFVLESFKSLVWASSILTFCDGRLLHDKTVTLWRSQMWPFVTNLWLAKMVTIKTVKESFKHPFLSGFFVTLCGLVYFYTSLAYSTDLLI
jgi:hypothetical protein